MLRGLEGSKGKGKGKGGFSVKKATFGIAGTSIRVDSWRMSDWDFKKPDLPTYSRGLFTTKNSKGHHEIVVRGYDKFFNHGEVRETEWRNVETNTRGPYELS
ncbi:tRNA ligase, partial [Teratosphaeriaceae sp. CCFEE 6253]